MIYTQRVVGSNARKITGGGRKGIAPELQESLPITQGRKLHDPVQDLIMAVNQGENSMTPPTGFNNAEY